MKIGFVQATNEIDVHWHRPLAYGYLKSYIEATLGAAVDMRLLDGGEWPEGLDVLAVSSTSQDFGAAIEIAREARRKKPGIVVVAGGHHITYMPETMTEDFDAGVMGEGEETFLELVRALMETGLSVGRADLSRIQGLAYHEAGRVRVTGRRAPIQPLDKIPHPWREPKDMPYLLTSRGCPYRCAYCSSSAFWDITRLFSAGYVVGEIESILLRYPGVTHLPIWDDLFIVNKPRFLEVIDLLRRKGITDKVDFAFAVRANLVDDELCENLRRMNVSAVSFGAESGSDKTLKTLKKNVTVARNQQAIDTLNRHGYKPCCSFIVGAPAETEEDVRRTYEFMIENMLNGKLSEASAVNILMPMPGTEMWDLARREGLVGADGFDWRRLTGYASYRASNFKDFQEFVDYRRSVGSVYMAEDTLPGERLYEVMSFYERTIVALEEKSKTAAQKDVLIGKYLDRISALEDSTSWRVTAPLRKIKGKIIKGR